jgi:branched-chain amino acid transport system ATP-binding protein
VEVAERTPLLEARKVTVRFGGVTAVDDVTAGFFSGEVCGLIGPNGAGKTTLFDTISGIRTPTKGRVVYDGVDVTSRSVTWPARNGIRRTFQRQQIFGWLSVEDNIMTALEWRGGAAGWWPTCCARRPGSGSSSRKWRTSARPSVPSAPRKGAPSC